MESKNYQLNEAKMFADVTDGIAIIINAVLEETTIGELTEDHIEQKKRIEHARLS